MTNQDTSDSRLAQMTIRPLTPADAPFLRAILYYAIFVPAGQEPPPRAVVDQPALAKYVRNFGRPGDLGYAAVDNRMHVPVGAVWVRLLTGDERGYGYVDDAIPELSAAVLPAYRGHGIGTALLQQLIETARTQYPAISLSVWPQNPAYRLYQRFGFEVVATDGSAVTMVKQLT